MNKLILTIISALALTVSTSTFSQDDGKEPGQKRPNHHRGAPGMPVTGMLFHAMKKLDLDGEQEAGIQAIKETMKTDLHPVMKAGRAGHVQLRELINSDVYDEDAVAAIAQKEGELAAERIMITSRAMSDALKLLSDEQREELKAMAAERKARRSERRKQRQQNTDS